MNQNVQATTLPNGVTVITDEMPGSGIVAISCGVDVGSRDECDRLAGASHLLEHMVFKGTARYAGSEIADIIERDGGSLNACTGEEGTEYSAEVLAEPVPVEKAIAVLSDMIFAPRLDKDDLEMEREVVVREILEAQDDADRRMHDLVKRSMFDGQSIGRSVAGSVETVRGITQGDLQRFHSAHYRPHHVIYSLAGGIDHATAVALVERETRNATGQHQIKRPPDRFNPQFVTEPEGRDQISVNVSWPAPHATHPDYQTVFTISNYLASGFSAPLWRALREDRSLCYHFSARYRPHSDAGFFRFHALTSDDSLDELLQVASGEIMAMLERVDPERLRRQCQDGDVRSSPVRLWPGLLHRVALCGNRSHRHLRRHHR
jgi:predicted Zn-dependent peptidase